MIKEAVFRMLLAIIIGFLIGEDREEKHKPAGLRDMIFVTFSCCLFALIGVQYLGAQGVDMARLLYAPIMGVGFLGSGVVMRGKHGVEGITTATTLFICVALGLMCGLGMYEFVCIASLLVCIILKGKTKIL